MQSSGEFAGGHIGGAYGAMGNAQSGRVVNSFRLGEELQCCVPLLGDFASDIMACPDPVEDRKFLRGISQIVNQRLRAQQDLLRFGCRVAATSDHCLTEHHL